MTDLKRIADALERIARAMERNSPPPKTQHEYQVEREFDRVAEKLFVAAFDNGTIFSDGKQFVYRCRFCGEEVSTSDPAHNCREPKP